MKAIEDMKTHISKATTDSNIKLTPTDAIKSKSIPLPSLPNVCFNQLHSKPPNLGVTCLKPCDEREKFLSCVREVRAKMPSKVQGQKETAHHIQIIQKLVWFHGLSANTSTKCALLRVASGTKITIWRDYCIHFLLGASKKRTEESKANKKSQIFSDMEPSFNTKHWLPPNCWSVMSKK